LILSSFLPRNANGVPLIDLVLLGLGADGHVASLFPETDILDVTDRYAAAVWLEEMKTWRVSITLPVINSAAHVWVMVTGESKHDILERVINFPSATNPLPIEQVKPASGLIWYLDAAAAKWLK
jgi:6-phosphogluconolactonase